ncbi:MAG TPA: SRPBCC domain-containing protein [Saprospiraceae bacterium]|nr:SRPBCC domain-containing protein [Saprospiraceae bacterium]
MAINVSRIKIKAEKSKVWEVITNPIHIKAWQFNSDLETTWQVDDDITFSTAWDGNIYKQWGKVIAYQPYEMVRYSLFAPRPGLEDIPENYFIMTYLLQDLDGETELEILQEDNRPNAVEEDSESADNPILNTLKNLAESL